MTDPSTKLEAFFKELQEMWDVLPKYVKVFLYVTVSGIITVLSAQALSVQPSTPEAVIAIGVVNSFIVGLQTAMGKPSK